MGDVTAPRVFISYSEDSPEHARWVCGLAFRLRDRGLDAWIDQFEVRPTDWYLWMEEQIDRADTVLLVCTKRYRQRFDRDPGQGLGGVQAEGQILRREVYASRPGLAVPVVRTAENFAHIPRLAANGSRYDLSQAKEFDLLVSDLKGEARVDIPPLGGKRPERRSFFGATVADGGESDTLLAYRGWAERRFLQTSVAGLGRSTVLLAHDRVYVELRIAPDGPGVERQIDGPDGPLRLESPQAKPIAVSSIFEGAGASRAALILGDPGGGKSTALRDLHRRCAADPAGLGLPDGTLPVFVRLSAFRPEDVGASLEAFLDRTLLDASGGRMAPGLGAELRRHGRLLFLLDGLDEIADAATRLDALRHLVWRLRSEEWAGAKVVFSCRLAGFGDKLRQLLAVERTGGRFVVESFRVQPLGNDQIVQLVGAWFQEAARRWEDYPEAEAGRAADHLIECLESIFKRADQQMEKLVANPLLLTLVCVAARRGGGIPRRWADFYEACLGVLLDADRRRPIPAALDAEQLRQVLERLAFFLHAKNRRENLKETEARRELKATLGLDLRQAGEVLEWLWQDAGLFERFERTRYGFSHLGFQEHFAARHLARGPRAFFEIGTYPSPGHSTWWREVFILVANLPDYSAVGPLLDFLIERRALVEDRGLLRECLAAARRLDRLDLEPLEGAFYRGPASDQLAVLDVLRGRREAAVIELLREFARSDAARTPQVQGELAALLPEAGGRESGARVVFVAHGAAGSATPALEALGAGLVSAGLEVANPAGWPAWSECWSVFDRGRITGLLLLLDDRLGDPEASELVDLLDVPVFVLEWPGDDRPLWPQEWEGLRRLTLDSMEEESVRRTCGLLAETLRRPPEQDGQGKALPPHSDPTWRRGDADVAGDRGRGPWRGGLARGGGEEASFGVERATTFRDGGGPSLGVEGAPGVRGEAGEVVKSEGEPAADSSETQESGRDGEPATRLDCSFIERITGEVFLRVPRWRRKAGHGDGSEIEIPTFWLARTPVTNQSYGLFLRETGAEPSPFWRHRDLSHPLQPVVGVNWYDAEAYCAWLTKASGERSGRFILPASEQWGVAAGAREFPWGSTPANAQLADFDRPSAPGPADVGSYPSGAGPYGHLDLAGGVREWCRDRFAAGGTAPFGAADYGVVRSSAWADHGVALRSAEKSAAPCRGQSLYLGFRVAFEPGPDFEGG
ncbi:MAG: SUMF1/EgtB/PvdO family nonheme iron enzyme [Acidobacteriota bacterium]